MKKRKGSVVDVLPALIVLLAGIILIMVYLNTSLMMEKREEVKQLSRSYLLEMETKGYLDAASKASLIQRLEEIPVKDIDLTGTTMTDAGYGNEIYLKISCSYSSKQLNTGGDLFSLSFQESDIPIKVQMMSTAKN